MSLLLLGAGGAGLTWTPSLLTDLLAAPIIADALAAGGLWQDVGKTTPATADGELVYVISDPHVPGLDHVALGSGNRATLRISGALSWLDFDGTNDAYNTAFAHTWVSLVHCVAAAVYVDTFSNYDAIAITTSINGFRLCSRTGTANKWGTYQGGDQNATTNLAASQLRTLIMNAGTYYFDGTSDGTYTGSDGAAAGTGNLHIGYDPGVGVGGGRDYDGRFYGAIVCGSSQIAGNIASMDLYLKAKQGR